MKNKIVFSLVFAAIISSLFATPVLAQGLDPLYHPDGLPTISESPEADAEMTQDQLRLELTRRIISVIMSIAGTVAVFFIILNAFGLATSAGGDAVEKNKKGLTWAVIGLVLIVLSYSIIRFIIGLSFQAQEETPGNLVAPQPTVEDGAGGDDVDEDSEDNVELF
ncbi:MAG: pilin [Patescibacteria group bacterium]